MRNLCKIFFFSLILSTSVWAIGTQSPWFSQGPDKKVIIKVDLFLSSTCPHCHKADAFFTSIAPNTPDLRVERHLINEDKNALLYFNQLLSEQHMDDFAVPSIYFCNSRWVGFATAETTGKDLLHAINYCREQISKQGALTQATVETLRHWANANKFGSSMVEHPSIGSYISTMAFTDAFAPCAFFVFAAFLAFLFIEKDRNRQLTVGGLFILAVGLMHYFQQVHADIFYQLLPWLRVPALLVGLFGIYWVMLYYKKRPLARWNYLFAVLFALLVMAYQQTCVMNWSYIFQQWLNNQEISALRATSYQALYQILYLLPLFLILLVYFALSKSNRFARLWPRLLTIGLLFIFAIALGLIFYPASLSSFGVSFTVLLLLLIVGYFLNWA